MAVFLRKMLRIGKLPDELRAEVEAEGILHLTEYVPVTRRFTGRVPGKRSAGSVASYVGSLVLTNQRVLATLSSVPKLAGRTIDLRWDASQSGAVKAELSDSGLLLEVERRRGRPPLQRPSVTALQGRHPRGRPHAAAPSITRLRCTARVCIPRCRGAVPPVALRKPLERWVFASFMNVVVCGIIA